MCCYAESLFAFQVAHLWLNVMLLIKRLCDALAQHCASGFTSFFKMCCALLSALPQQSFCHSYELVFTMQLVPAEGAAWPSARRFHAYCSVPTIAINTSGNPSLTSVASSPGGKEDEAAVPVDLTSVSLLVFGGVDDGASPLADLWAFNTSTRTWQLLKVTTTRLLYGLHWLMLLRYLYHCLRVMSVGCCP